MFYPDTLCGQLPFKHFIVFIIHLVCQNMGFLNSKKEYSDFADTFKMPLVEFKFTVEAGGVSLESDNPCHLSNGPSTPDSSRSSICITGLLCIY